MLSIRKQEFIEMFLPGLVYLIIGISGYLIKGNIINLIAFILATSYSIFTFTKRKMKKQKDDDDSLKNKDSAGHVTFLLILVVLNFFLGIMVFVGLTNGKGFYTTLTFDLNFLCIILGALKVVYYLSFIYFDRTE